jgi:NADPH-dependent 2,4-dienoyl-CoA reductase/sulfur reductase-like enzyme/rhodanese-related sulfurtransferase
MKPLRLVVVGGVAGGASAAARARRLSEDASIVVLERGPHVSFASCGLPYHVGGEIAERDALLLQSPHSLKARFNLDVRVRHEALAIDRAHRTVRVRELESGREYFEPYDALVLATGATPVQPPIPGLRREGHFQVRTVPDADAINNWIKSRSARRAVVVGGGYIGLEMAEQLQRRGLEVTLVEAMPHVMTPLDPEMAGWLHAELKANGVALRLSDAVAAFEPPAASEHAAASRVVLNSGARLPADLVVLGLGVKPEVTLARDAGLEIGDLGGIRVDAHLRTSDPAVWAVGDAIEVRHAVTGQWQLIPLAGPANRQGRTAADNIFGRRSTYGGTLGTAVLRLFRLTAACTGANEAMLSRVGRSFQAVHLHPTSHAGYFPGAEPIALKVLFDPDNGALLGAQAVGVAGVDKRMDVLATALKAGLTVHELADLELCYAPPLGSAKDPVNLAGMAAQNVLRGDVRLAQWRELPELEPARTLVLDVRSTQERAAGHIPGSQHIPLPELRDRLDELPRDMEIIVSCQSGQRSYFASRLLAQRGFNVRNLTGSYRTWKMAPRVCAGG